MPNTDNIKRNPTEDNLDNTYYPHMITWSKKTPKTFKIPINLRIDRLKKLYRTINDLIN